MAWESVHRIDTGKARSYTVTLTADGSGAFTDNVSQEFPNGYLTAIDIDPGSTTPDSTTTVKVLNEAGVDILNGAGASIDLTGSKRIEPEDDNGNAKLAPFVGSLTLNVTTNGTASASAQFIFNLAFPR